MKKSHPSASPFEGQIIYNSSPTMSTIYSPTETSLLFINVNYYNDNGEQFIPRSQFPPEQGL